MWYILIAIWCAFGLIPVVQEIVDNVCACKKYKVGYSLLVFDLFRFIVMICFGLVTFFIAYTGPLMELTVFKIDFSEKS